MRIVIFALVTALLAGCGAGGGVTASAPGLWVDLDTQASSADTVIYAAELVLHLPAGVTLSADPSTGKLLANVLQAADSGALAAGRYQPATAAARALVKINVTDPRGFTVGGLATLGCIIAPGAAVSTADFSLDGFSARDANGAVIPGITPHLAVRMQ